MRKQKFWQKILLFALCGAGFLLGLRFLGPVLLPFAVGFLIAHSAEPLILRLQNGSTLPRWLCAGIGVTGIYLLFSLVIFILCRLIWQELAAFVTSLPQLLGSLAPQAAALEQRLLQLASGFPDGIGKALEESIAAFFRNGAGLGSRIYNWIFRFISGLLRKIPDFSLFLLTAVLSGFMISAKLPQLQKLWQKKVPQNWQEQTGTVLDRLKVTLGGWLRAQLKLMGLSALVLTIGFLILGVNYPLLFGLVIALVDALPALGTGLILIPWSLVSFLQGNTFLGVGLLLLFAAAALLRTALEPRMLGKQIGLDPLLTLLSLYAGYRFLGLPGMIFFPIAAIMVKQFWKSEP